MSLTTSTLLLQGIRDPRNELAWEMFDALYRPMILAFGHRIGLQKADAEDLAQDVMMTFRGAFPRYNRSRGKFRSWLFGVMIRTRHHTLRRLRRREHQFPGSSRTTVLAKLPDPREGELEALWEEEWRQFVWAVMRRTAAHRFREHVLQAFELNVRQGLPVEQVARTLGTTPEVVRKAKQRVLAHLRRIAAQLDLEV